MTDDQHAEGAPGGRWNPLPQGDYDDGATAFVKLPEGGIEALLAADSPLAAPGHGYVPPQITVTSTSPAATDPAATGGWAAPAEGTQWPDPNAVPQDGGGDAGADDRFAHRPEATQQWTFQDDHSQAQPQAPESGHDVTGQWSIPVAGGDLPDESGEFTTSSLVQQWGGTPPATLPGGAPAPWATEAIGQPWSRPEQDPARGAYDGEPAAHPYGAEPRTADPHPEAPAAQPRPEAPTAPAAETAHAPGQPAAGPHASLHPEHPRHSGHLEHPRHPDHPGQSEHPGRPEHPGPESGASAVSRTDTGGAPDPDGAPGHAATTSSAPRQAQPGAVQDAETVPELAAEVTRPAAGADKADGEGVQGPVEPAEGAAERPAAPDPAEDPADARQAAEEPVTASNSTAAEGEPGAAHQEAAAPEGPPPAPPQDEHPLASYVLRVNGVDRPVTDAWIGESLLYVLRERLGLAGAKDGCSQGECGACNVQVDGRLVASCLVPAVTAAGSEVRTVEGLAVDGQPSDVQRALARCGAVQCGFCVPGMAMTVHDLLEGNPAPTELETRQALCGNLCRCSGYKGVLRAVEEVVAEREAHAAAEHTTTADGGETDAEEPRIPHQAAPGAGGIHPSAFDSPEAHGHHEPHDPYGQDGGQA